MKDIKPESILKSSKPEVIPQLRVVGNDMEVMMWSALTMPMRASSRIMHSGSHQ